MSLLGKIYQTYAMLQSAVGAIIHKIRDAFSRSKIKEKTAIKGLKVAIKVQQ